MRVRLLPVLTAGFLSATLASASRVAPAELIGAAVVRPWFEELKHRAREVAVTDLQEARLLIRSRVVLTVGFIVARFGERVLSVDWPQFEPKAQPGRLISLRNLGSDGPRTSSVQTQTPQLA